MKIIEMHKHNSTNFDIHFGDIRFEITFSYLEEVLEFTMHTFINYESSVYVFVKSILTTYRNICLVNSRNHPS